MTSRLPQLFLMLFLHSCSASVVCQTSSKLIDMHVHAGPDTVPRLLDDAKAAQDACAAGMSAIVLKNHAFQTAVRAQLLQKQQSCVEVFGGIVLNRSSGGINPEAVDAMVRMEGQRGRIVWMPTRDANDVALFDDAGAPVAGLVEILRMISRHDLVLATGHVRGNTLLRLVELAEQHKVHRILLSHALSESVGASRADIEFLASRNAMVELVVLPTLTNPSLIDRYAEMVRSIGPQHFVIASDLGQPGNPEPAKGLIALLEQLKLRGVSAQALEIMTVSNPGWLLGLRDGP